MSKDYRQFIYDSYMSVGFGTADRVSKIQNEFRIHSKYFKKNYLRYMPKNRESCVADLGCGLGHFLVFCKEAGYKNTIGVDISEENIIFLNKQGLKVEKNNIDDFLDKYINKFDCIVFNDVMEHLKKDETIETLLKIRKSLRGGGTVLIKTPNMANPFVSTVGRYIDFTHEIGYTEHSLKQVLRAVGFKQVSIKGTDVYVFNPVINVIAKGTSKILEFLLFMLSYLFGRKSIKIFTKDILAIAKKQE